MNRPELPYQTSSFWLSHPDPLGAPIFFYLQNENTFSSTMKTITINKIKKIKYNEHQSSVYYTLATFLLCYVIKLSSHF